MIVPANPSAEYKLYKHEIDEAITRVLDKGNYILGEEVLSFEREFAHFVGARYAVGVASGTDALYLALLANGIELGDEVITVSHTAVATVSAVVQTGATPVYADINPTSFNIDEDLILSLITKRTKFIVPVHLYGNPANIEKIVSIANSKNLRVIEDCAQAHGTTFQGKHVGTFGMASSFSFYPTKNIGAIGDGGMVVTDSEEIYRKVVLLRQYGWKDRYVSSCHGWNSRLDELQAAILRVKLRHFTATLGMRKTIALRYLNEIKNKKISLPTQHQHGQHSYHLFVIRSAQRDLLIKYLLERGIGSQVHYPKPVHLQPGYAQPAVRLPWTEKIADEVLSLPLYPGLEEGSISSVIKHVNEF